jgi:hypothetical protein
MEVSNVGEGSNQEREPAQPSTPSASNQMEKADAQCVPDLPTKFEQLKFIRDEIRFEHSLLGQRVSWLLASNAFLLAAFAESSQQAISSFPEAKLSDALLPFYVIPLFGLVSSFMLIPAVTEAARRITQQRELLYTPGHHLGLEPLTQVLRPGRGNTAHNRSVQYARWMPYLCVVLWLGIGLAGQVVAWSRKGSEPTHGIELKPKSKDVDRAVSDSLSGQVPEPISSDGSDSSRE